MKFNKKYFKRRMQDLRMANAHTYNDIAKGTNLTTPGVYTIINGDTTPTIDTFVRLCEFYRQSPEVFFDKFKSTIKPTIGD